MKKTFLTVLVCGAAAFSCASAEIIWVDGVSIENGWFDVNKSSTTNADDMMCYAASAANLIAWWQNKLPGVPAGTPTHANAIWQEYVNAANNGASNGGNVASSLNWWLSGIYDPLNEEEGARHAYGYWLAATYSELKAAKGYYFDQCNLTTQDLWNFTSFNEVDSGDYITIRHSYSCSSDLLKDWIQAGKGISLGLSHDNGQLAHAVTLWGMEYNDAGDLTHLYITDSDDTRVGDVVSELVKLTVDKISETGHIYFHSEKEQWQVGQYIYTRTMYEEGTYIDEIYFLNPSAFVVTIPEPATTTLGMLALAGLAGRRRRR